MIALGGTIGTGLFVGSGQTLARGGPAFILSTYIAMSFLIFCTVAGIIEVAAYLPTPGSSMNLFGYRYVSRYPTRLQRLDWSLSIGTHP